MLRPLKGASFKSHFLNLDDSDRTCYCGEIENEKHFICFCPLYVDIRKKYLDVLFDGSLSNHYTYMLKCTDEKVSRNLGMYVSYTLQSRDLALENSLISE